MADPDQCTATAKSTGERCKQPAIPGGDVCRFHGGSAEQVERKAQERLDEMADAVTAEMQAKVHDLLAQYEHADPDDRVTIMRELRHLWTEILDRTGHGPAETRELETTGDGLEIVADFTESDGE